MQVRWERLDPATIEQLIAVLLSLDNPDVVRIDGRGGDGGRDVQFRRPDGVHFYEIKSFADRVDPRRGRRAKHREVACGRGPPEPRLVDSGRPRGPDRGRGGLVSPAQPAAPLPPAVAGLTWLSARLAQHPEVQRYYLSDERDAVLSLLHEQDPLAADASDADAVLARLDSVAQRLRTLIRTL